MLLKDKFSHDDERAFKASEEFIPVFLIRVLFALFAVLYALYALTDLIYFPTLWPLIFALRFGLVIPVFIITIVLSYTKIFIKYYQPLMMVNFVVGGLAIAFMLILSPNNVVYYGGLFMVYFSGYFLVKLRFVPATLSGFSILLFHFFGTLLYQNNLNETFYYGMLFFLGANLIGMMGAYNNEYMQRKQFLRDQDIEKINAQLKKQNEEKALQLQQIADANRKNEAQHRLTEALKETESRFEQISMQSRTIFYELNAEGLYTYASKAMETILGYTIDEIVNQRYFYELFPKAMREEYKKMGYEELAKGKVISDFINPLETKSGKIVWMTSFMMPVYNPSGELIAYHGSDMDITEQKQKQDEIKHISYHDFLTKIPNRRYYHEKLESLDKERYYPLAVVIFDFNGLKVINDAFGHDAGNEALIKVANTIKNAIGDADVCARIGGDEFALLLPKTNLVATEKILQHIKQKIKKQSVQGINYSLAVGYEFKQDLHYPISEVMNAAENMMYKNKVLEGSSMRNRAIMSILKTLTDKYEEEKIHSKRVSEYCRAIGQGLDIKGEALKELELAGMLHDIGKISIPDEILKKPGSLNQAEWAEMKNHTLNGYQILRAADQYSDLAEYAMTHHERIDGQGYPNGIKGKKIPLYSRIIAVADAYEAMTSDRPYRKAISHEEAIAELNRYRNTQFDGKIVDVFIEKVLKEKDPTKSLS